MESDAWEAAVAGLPMPIATAGLIHLHLGQEWPPYLNFILRASAANVGIAFYFLGPDLDTSSCASCHRLPLDESMLAGRIEKHLNISRASVLLRPRKLCDLKPMWAALFPELTARHAWIGYSDYDILYGDLAREVAELQESDEMLVPSAYFPQPLANGNLLLVRSTSKMVRAFERSGAWRQAVLHDGYWVFDEWWGSLGESMLDVYHQMLLEGDLRVRPTSRGLAQDTVILNQLGAGTWTTIDRGATVKVLWRAGRLVGERTGPCLCPNDTSFTLISAFSSTVCRMPRRADGLAAAARLCWPAFQPASCDAGA